MEHGDRAREPAHELHVVLDDEDRAALPDRSSSAPVWSLSGRVMPATGSSSSSSVGSCDSSMAISSHCFWPWDSGPAGRSASLGQPDLLQHGRDGLAVPPTCAAARVAVKPLAAGGQDHVLGDSWPGNTAGVWNLRPDAEGGDGMGARAGAGRRRRRRRGRARPHVAGDARRQSVVLPAPLGPIRKRSPLLALDDEVQLAQGQEPVEGDGQVLDVEQRRHGQALGSRRLDASQSGSSRRPAARAPAARARRPSSPSRPRGRT